jgi:hypothetical protein
MNRIHLRIWINSGLYGECNEVHFFKVRNFSRRRVTARLVHETLFRAIVTGLTGVEIWWEGVMGSNHFEDRDRNIRKFLSSGTRSHALWWTSTDVSVEPAVSVFRIGETLYLEREGNSCPHHVGIRLTNYTATSHEQYLHLGGHHREFPRSLYLREMGYEGGA